MAGRLKCQPVPEAGLGFTCGRCEASAHPAAATGVESLYFLVVICRSRAALHLVLWASSRSDRRRAGHGIRSDLQYAPISFGVPPAAASASVHVIRTLPARSRRQPYRASQRDWRLFWRLLVPGVVGGCDRRRAADAHRRHIAKPLSDLLARSASISSARAWRSAGREAPAGVEPLGFAGGFPLTQRRRRWGRGVPAI